MSAVKQRYSIIIRMNRYLNNVQNPDIPLTFYTATVLLEQVELQKTNLDIIHKSLVDATEDAATINAHETVYKQLNSKYLIIVSTLNEIIATTTPDKPEVEKVASAHHISSSSYPFCEDHFEIQCPMLASRTEEGRITIANESRVCFNCLKHTTPPHMSKECQSRDTCSLCEKKEAGNRPDFNQPPQPDQPVNVVHHAQPQSNQLMSSTSHITAEEVLQDFRFAEEVPSRSLLIKEEIGCKGFFTTTTATNTRDYEGRFVVRVPCNDQVPALGSTRSMATPRHQALETQLYRHPQHCLQHEVVDQYLPLVITETVPVFQLQKFEENCFYLPCHCVVTQDSTTTGLLLNQYAMDGPTIPPHLSDVLLHFRMHQAVLKMDLRKMFCQFRLHPEDANSQWIVWNNPNQSVLNLGLPIVTYATASAPYQATRCVMQLGMCLATATATTEAATTQEVIQLYKELNNICNLPKSNICKWPSYSQKVICQIPIEFYATDPASIKKETLKALGVQHAHPPDIFVFQCLPQPTEEFFTKRKLSIITKMFFYIGLITPTTERAPVLVVPMPGSIYQEWKSYYEEDARSSSSSKAPRCKYVFGAALYIKPISKEGRATLNLILSKFQIAPIRQMSQPRLELPRALVIAEEIINSSSWWKEPQFIQEDEDSTFNLPISIFVVQKEPQCNNAIPMPPPPLPPPVHFVSTQSTHVRVTTMMFSLATSASKLQPPPPLLSSVRVDSTPSTCVCVIAVMFRFAISARKLQPPTLLPLTHARVIAVMLCLATSAGILPPPTKVLSATELLYHLSIRHRRVQHEHFQKDFKNVKKNKSIQPSNIRKSLSPFVDPGGVSRLTRRIFKANLPDNVKFQAVSNESQPSRLPSHGHHHYCY